MANKNYLDGFMWSILDKNNIFAENNYDVVEFKNLSDLHNVESCNTIAFSFWSNHLSIIDNALPELSKKCNHLVIFVAEPTDSDFCFYEKKWQQEYKNLYIICEIVPNYESKIITHVTWILSIYCLYTTYKPIRESFQKLEHTDNREFLFDCLLGKKREHRDKIQDFYISSKSKDKIIFSYHAENVSSGIWDIDVSDYTDTSENHLSCFIPYYIYNKSYYTIVAETLDNNEFSFFTEKVIKPIISLRPFIVFSGQYYLRNLQSLGFKTFSECIDETYDLEPDKNLRYKMAWEQVEYLISLPPDEVISKLRPILEHNRQHYFNTVWEQPTLDLLKKICCC